VTMAYLVRCNSAEFGPDAPSRHALPKDKLRAIRDGQSHLEKAPDFAEFIIGRAFARPVGSIRATVAYSAAVTVLAGTFAPAP
jgi:hypothetical protein